MYLPSVWGERRAGLSTAGAAAWSGAGLPAAPRALALTERPQEPRAAQQQEGESGRSHHPPCSL